VNPLFFPRPSFLLLFIFSTTILGEINNFYGSIPYCDKMLHTINGFIAAGVGFALIDLLNQNTKSVNLSPIFVAIVSFCFSMTIGIIWEFFEYSADKYFNTDMQKDRIVENINSVKLNEEGKKRSEERSMIAERNSEMIADDLSGFPFAALWQQFYQEEINDSQVLLAISLCRLLTAKNEQHTHLTQWLSFDWTKWEEKLQQLPYQNKVCAIMQNLIKRLRNG